jgi:ubiquinone/menaquinone biosynthesis C-methylase UbiE
MSIYSKYVFPFMMDLAMRADPFRSLRFEIVRHIHGSILEIGSGTGLNFSEYPKSIDSLETVDPNLHSNRKAKKRADTLPFPVIQHQISAEILPFASDQFDFVISTWTLCSIPDLESTLLEVNRVLKSTGKFLFVEHGLSPDKPVQKWQHRLTPFQKCIADGCHLNRDIPAMIQDAGFEIKELKQFYLKNTPKVAGYFYQGSAIKF